MFVLIFRVLFSVGVHLCVFVYLSLRLFLPKEIAYRTTAYYLLLCSFTYELAYVCLCSFVITSSLCYVDYCFTY